MPGNIKSGKRLTLKLHDYGIYTLCVLPWCICFCIVFENMDETLNTSPVCSLPHTVTDMFASFPVSVVWLLLVYLLFCSRLTSVRAASICTSTHTGCHVLSLANLFDRVIQHSTRMHSITNDLHSEFVSRIWTPHGWRMIVSVMRSFFLIKLSQFTLKIMSVWFDSSNLKHTVQIYFCYQYYCSIQPESALQQSS